MKRAGLDIGSRNIKIVYSSESGEFRFKKLDTVEFFKEYVINGEKKFFLKYEKLFDNFIPEYVVATGYGKLALNIKTDATISEIKAHALGALYQTKEETFVLVDIGGQDTKVITVMNGKVVDFYMNNKCAAGSGRYVENMANVLGFDIETFSQKKDNPIKIDSTCATFGESEVLSRVFEGVPVDEIAAGVNEAVAKKIIPFVRKNELKKIYLSGGVAQNEAVFWFMKKFFPEREVKIVPNPQFNAAIGAINYEK